jgi:hypothetical protein
VVFDFWKQAYLGRHSGEIDCPALPLGHCQILAIRPALNRPQLLSSSRHVSQDAVSVAGQSWADHELTLKLRAVRGTAETYWIHVPAGYAVARADGDGLTPHVGRLQTVGARDGALPIRVEFPAGTEDCTQGALTVRFSKR